MPVFETRLRAKTANHQQTDEHLATLVFVDQDGNEPDRFPVTMGIDEILVGVNPSATRYPESGGRHRVAPTIISENNATATIGNSFSFTVKTTGQSVLALKEKGRLPKGIKFVRTAEGTATLRGTPVSTRRKPAAGRYPVVFIAEFGTNRAKLTVKQNFTLTVM